VIKETITSPVFLDGKAKAGIYFTLPKKHRHLGP